jgi:hypothetical protein
MNNAYPSRTLGPSTAPNQKITLNLMYLDFNFRRGLFYAKMPKSKYFIRLPLD